MLLTSTAASLLSIDGNIAVIVTVIVAGVVAILGPFLSYRLTVKKMNKANGATKRSGVDWEQYKDYNLFDLALEARIDARDAKVTATHANQNVVKILNHLGIEE